MGNASQALTGLGKWWGRKPLVLVRATILGLLLPATDDPQKDREVFLKLMTMDAEGLVRRRSKTIPLKQAYALLSDAERSEWFEKDADPERPRFKTGRAAAGRAIVQELAFSRLSYDEKLEWCGRAYLYCTETRCPECGYLVPMAPSWLIGEKTHTFAKLVADAQAKRFAIEIHQGASKAELEAAKRAGTTPNSRLVCPNHPDITTPIAQIRGDRRGAEGAQYGLRLWENDDLVPRPEDVFQERLYCIRWVRTWIDDEDRRQQERWYAAPTPADVEREARALTLLRERFHDWQAKGYLPIRRMKKSFKPSATKPSTHW